MYAGTLATFFAIAKTGLLPFTALPQNSERFFVMQRRNGMTTPKRSAQEARRLIGGQRLENRCDVDKIVNALQVSAKTVYNWKNKIRNEGVDGFLRKNGLGRPCKLNADQREKLKDIIRNGAVAYGFDREQRTSKRVRLVIFEQFHVEYNSNDVCEILSHLGRSYGNTAQQIPVVHSVKRNQEAIDHWKKYVWLRLKKTKN